MKKTTMILAALTVVLTALAGEPIYDQPAGVLKNYNRDGQCIVYDYSRGFYVAYQEGKVNIVFAEDGKVYIKDLVYDLPYGSWVEGTLGEDGKTITVPMGQVMYHSPFYDSDVVLSWGSTSEGIVVGANKIEVNYTPDETVEAAVFTIDGENIRLEGSVGAQVLTAEDMAEFAATGLSAIWMHNQAWVQTIDWGTLFTEIPSAMPAVPANPEVISWRDLGNENGYNRLQFHINPYDINGNPLDLEQGQLTYSVFTDNDQLFTFTSDMYGYDFNYQDATEVPYGMYGYDFSPEFVYFYRTNAEGYERFFTWRIGIQVYYTVDGVRNASDIVYLEVFSKPTGIDEVIGDKAIAGIRYFNMAGQEMAQPSGMTIQVTTYSDGTTATAKVMK